MSDYRLVIHDEAHDAIFRNADWWAEHHSLDQAILWQDAIYRQLSSLTAMPERKALAAEDSSFEFEIREMLVGLGTRPRYRAIFTIRERTVHVLTLLDSAQDELKPEELPDREF